MSKTKYILASLVFFILVTPSYAALKCGDAEIVIDHPAYEKFLKGSGAAYDPDNNIIALSTEYMAQKTDNVRRFIFAHECGHYHLKNTPSHAEMGNPQAEFDADAYAVEVAKRNHAVFSEEDLAMICEDVGPDRCNAILKRFKE